jgi:hypothetical protein
MTGYDNVPQLIRWNSLHVSTPFLDWLNGAACFRCFPAWFAFCRESGLAVIENLVKKSCIQWGLWHERCFVSDKNEYTMSEQ